MEVWKRLSIDEQKTPKDRIGCSVVFNPAYRSNLFTRPDCLDRLPGCRQGRTNGQGLTLVLA